MEIVHVRQSASVFGVKSGGITGAVAIQKEILCDSPRLGGDNRGIISSGVPRCIKSLLNLRHRLLGGGSCEHLGLNLRCVIACGDLLCAGGREKRGDDRGEQHNHEQRENERRGVFGVFWQIAFQNIKG